MKIGFIGAGKMAEGILLTMPGKGEVLMAERSVSRAQFMSTRYGVVATQDVKFVASRCDLIFLSVCPQDVEEVAAQVKPILKREQVLVSIVAGKTLAKLKALFGSKVKIIRVMPNLALRAGAGMCALTAHNDIVEKILGRAGETVVLKEKDFDAVTALSGSGPAYFAYMVSSMVAAGKALGLKPPVARLLAEQTMFGTAKYLHESGVDLKAFIKGVCTKGGTTEAGINELSKGGAFDKLVLRTLTAAAKKSQALAK